jgi:hypothetical protein
MFKCKSFCCNNGFSGGLEVVAFSGNLGGLDPKKGIQGSPVCDLNISSNIRHVVIVANNFTYPIDIDCTGTIPSSPSRKVEFHSVVSTDTDIKWHDTASLTVAVNPKDPPIEHPFDHVQLLHTTGQGPNDVDIEVIATAPHRPSYTVPIRITVTV